jgi:CubicO group peptidase (beta-lactamase class C family)
MDPAQLERALSLIEGWTESGFMPAAVLHVARHGQTVVHQEFGRTTVAPGGPPTQQDSIFIIASITKPTTYTALLRLVDEGIVSLSDPVSRYIPEFSSPEHDAVQVRHIMTHTSGLPDMVPNNVLLRRQHAPFATFIDHICKVPLLFSPGTNISYQSAGTALAAEIVQRVRGKPLREVLAAEVFRPLGMESTSLGWLPEREPRIVEATQPSHLTGSDYDHNSLYWREFGAPWGGLFSTVADISRFMEVYRQGGSLDGARILSPALATAMLSDQTNAMPGIPAAKKLEEGWGLGFRLFRRANPVYFGDLVAPGSFGHTGSTGTFAWCDPSKALTAVFFCNQLHERVQHEFQVLSNTIAAAVRD